MGRTTVITAGSTYQDIDAYACCVALKELLLLQGIPAVAYSKAPRNYSVHPMLVEPGQMTDRLPQGDLSYIIADVSDPDYLSAGVPLEAVTAVYDHHTGFESYWAQRIGDGAHIEFLGAAATLIWRGWEKAGLSDRMAPATARLLVAAILDNTLDLTSHNTTREDIDAFHALCRIGGVDRGWCDDYFAKVQELVEEDLPNALLSDIKRLRDHQILPPSMAQLCVWDAEKILDRLPQIRQLMADQGAWMINLIGLRQRRSWFLCDDACHQKKLSEVFGVRFENGVAPCGRAWLRKEIIRHTQRI